MKQEKKMIRRFIIALPIAAALVMPLFAHAAGHGNPPPPSAGQTPINFSGILQYTGIAVAIAVALITYLSGNLEKWVKFRKTDIENKQLKSKLDRLTSADVDGVSQTAAERATTIQLASIRSEFALARSEVDRQILGIERRAYLNLTIGTLVSLAAILILVAQAVLAPPQDLTWERLFVTYFPKLITCLFIELLAFFFLKLYRTSLTELRIAYATSRELTFKHIAFESTWDQSQANGARTQVAISLFAKQESSPSDMCTEENLDTKSILETVQRLAEIGSKR